MNLGVFPGQGVSAQDVLSALPSSHPLLDKADDVLCYDLTQRVERATRVATPMPTSLAQPAIFVASVISWDSREASSIDVLAGHSLGEYAALVAGGAISFAHALCVVQVRGEAMQRASKTFGGGMAAVIGLPLEEVETIADTAGVSVANDNAPLQVVVSGPEDRLAAVAAMSKDRGARCIRVEVGGSFHTHAMDDAQAPLRDALDHSHIRMPKVPIISNISARPYRAPGEIRKLLVQQVSGRVRFRESLAWAASKGVRTFVDFGPGIVAGRMAKRNLAATLAGAIV